MLGEAIFENLVMPFRAYVAEIEASLPSTLVCDSSQVSCLASGGLAFILLGSTGGATIACLLCKKMEAAEKEKGKVFKRRV